ncbi:MAG TPA: cytidylate kinase-like family protein [Syntrophales bacterium]|nr:cytidylate kinase-like family protein [Syntrophales bacterium]HOM06548.1 cytidylate kinase-like family protein [Syntrophales bacterium]HON99669.1 cytidylate kinase-like family protein [Syntrophales bacterium]HPC00660.1 cytidylate kinase-like family protein [Syntrophales bacterium]HPQ06190.1 cytidylate kinase-like family protein [Syntrophales bacterium]
MAIRKKEAWQLVEEQLTKWNVSTKEKKKEEGEKPRPVITISREAGCGGTKIAKMLAERLGMDLMGGKIIQMVAESVEMSEKVVQSLDEKEITKRDDWLNSLFETRHLWPDQYLHHLTKVIGTIGRHGNAIILGRGANFILPEQDTFRVRIMAPYEVKVKNILRTTREEAERYLIKTEADRRAFIRKYFNQDVTDPVHYDLTINMRAITVEGAVEAIIAAFKSWRP